MIGSPPSLTPWWANALRLSPSMSMASRAMSTTAQSCLGCCTDWPAEPSRVPHECTHWILPTSSASLLGSWTFRCPRLQSAIFDAWPARLLSPLAAHSPVRLLYVSWQTQLRGDVVSSMDNHGCDVSTSEPTHVVPSPVHRLLSVHIYEHPDARARAKRGFKEGLAGR